ncbi:MAG TPA: chromate transporter [Trueperaceae bacterium]|nr:chromate transporter [Trueperaceae bacterium]
MQLLRLLWSFTKVGLVGFGGGPAMIPLIQEEVVAAQHWLTKDEFLDAFAFGSSLPGPLATKLAGYVGFKVAGWPGALMGLLGMAVPTILAMIALGALYMRYRHTPAIEHFLRGVRPVVVALLALVVWEFAPRAFGMPPQWLRNWALWLLAVGAFVLSLRFNVHPALLIVAGGLLGVFVIH